MHDLHYATPPMLKVFTLSTYVLACMTGSCSRHSQGSRNLDLPWSSGTYLPMGHLLVRTLEM